MANEIRGYLSLPGSWLGEFEAGGLLGIASHVTSFVSVELDRWVAVNRARLLARTDDTGRGFVLSMSLDSDDAEAWRGGDDEPGAPVEALWVDGRNLTDFESVLTAPVEIVGFYS